jgi:hypothetical protein
VTDDDYLDPGRNMRAAVARIQQALAALDEAASYPEVLEQLEKAHYRIERAQRELVADAIEDGTSWPDIAGPLGLNPGQARARFRESAWLGRGGGS